MNWRSTLWLLGATLGLGLFISLVERPARLARARASELPRILPTFDPGAVRSVELRFPSNSIVLQRTNELWTLPAGQEQHAAQTALVESFLLRVSNLRGRSVLAAAELRSRPNAAREFGLDPATTTAVFTTGDGRLELAFGTHSVNGAHLFFQIVGVPGIFSTEALLLDRLPRNHDGWRDTSLVPLSQLDFDRIRVSAAGAAFTLARGPSNAVWHLIEPRPARADSLRIGILLRQLSQIQVSRFLESTSVPNAELAGLRPPRLLLSLARGTNEVFSLGFGVPFTNGMVNAATEAVAAANAPFSPPLVIARRSLENDPVVVPAEALELLRVPYKDLLDRRLVRCDPHAVREIEFAGREGFRLVRLEDAWLLQPGNDKADPDLITHLFSHLASLEILDIAKEVVTDLDLANYGLAPPSSQITLRAIPGDTNTVLARLEIGPLRGTTVFARVPGEAPVYLLNPADLESLPSKPWQLRDRQPWAFAAAQVLSVSARLPGMDWSVRRQGTNEWAGPPGIKADINPFALEEALHRFANARAIAWVGEGDTRATALGIGRGVEFTVEFRPPGATTPAAPPLRFSVGKRTPSGNRYASVPQIGAPKIVFELPGHAFEDLWRELGLSGTPPPL